MHNRINEPVLDRALNAFIKIKSVAALYRKSAILLSLNNQPFNQFKKGIAVIM